MPARWLQPAQPQSQDAVAPQAGLQAQVSPQPQVGPQAQSFSPGAQALVWSQVQALAWSSLVM